MVVIICGKYGNNQSRTEDVTEWTRFSKSSSNDLEDIDQGQRSSHATHLLMLLTICPNMEKNPSRTVDWHGFQGQGQITLKIYVKVKGHYMQHTLSYLWSFVLNMERIHRELLIFFQIWQKFKFPDSEKNVTRETPPNDSDHLCQI